MAKTVNIDTPNSSLPPEVQEQIERQNARETKQILMKQGINALVEFQDEQTRSTASTSYVQQESLRQAFASSGGWIEAVFKTSAYNGGSEIFVRLTLDGDVKDTAFAGIGCLVLRYAGFLNAGNHVLDISIKTSAGTSYMGRDNANNPVPTSLWVTETIL